MKKLLKAIRNLLVFIGWTTVFVIFSNLLINLVWHFDFMSSHSWFLLSSFWNHGGVIKTTSDILLLLSLFLLPFLWIVGFILALRLQYKEIFLKPIDLIINLFSSSDTNSERLVLKNIKDSEQIIEEIKTEIDSIKPEESKNASDIRSDITQKISAEIKNQRK